jgi:hypothetical protein
MVMVGDESDTFAGPAKTGVYSPSVQLTEYEMAVRHTGMQSHTHILAALTCTKACGIAYIVHAYIFSYICTGALTCTFMHTYHPTFG